MSYYMIPIFIPCFMGVGGHEILIIALVVLLLFGAKKIPELMKGIGKGISGFKQGLNEIENDITNTPK